MLRTATLIVALLFGALVGAAPAQAAGSCTVSPNPDPVGTDYTVTGAGLAPSDDWVLNLQQAGNHSASINVIVFSDTAGAFSQPFDWISAQGQWNTGTVAVTVYEYDAAQNRGFQHGPSAATCAFTVV